VFVNQEQTLFDFSEGMIILQQIELVLLGIGIELLQFCLAVCGFSAQSLSIFGGEVFIKCLNMCPQGNDPALELI